MKFVPLVLTLATKAVSCSSDVNVNPNALP